MRIEITGVSLKNGIITITATDISEENLQRIERTRDEFQQELEFSFDTKHEKTKDYIGTWLHRQKATANATTWGEALHSIVGTVTDSPKKLYRVSA